MASKSSKTPYAEVNLVGLSLEYARSISTKKIRETKKDGRPCVVTRDFDVNRVNVHTESGFIVSVEGIG